MFIVHRTSAMIGLAFGMEIGGLGAVLIGGTVSGALDRARAPHGGRLMFIGVFLSRAAWSTKQQLSFRMALSSAAVLEVMIRTIITAPPI